MRNDTIASPHRSRLGAVAARLAVEADEPHLNVASIVLGAAALLAINALAATTSELRLSVLYAIVVMAMTWLNGRVTGLLFAAAAGAALLLAHG